MSCSKIRGKRGPARLGSAHTRRGALHLPSSSGLPSKPARYRASGSFAKIDPAATVKAPTATGTCLCVWPRPLPTHQQTPHRRPQRSRLHSLASRKTETSSGAPEFVETLYCQVAAQVGEKPEGFSFRSHLEHRKLKHKNIEIEVYVFWISIGTKIT
jgi:hypothetical protein